MLFCYCLTDYATLGDPVDPDVGVGLVIDPAAERKGLGYIEVGWGEGKLMASDAGAGAPGATGPTADGDQREVFRAEVVLLAADGLRNDEIAHRLGTAARP